jgi:hypothetical protein
MPVWASESLAHCRVVKPWVLATPVGMSGLPRRVGIWGRRRRERFCGIVGSSSLGGDPRCGWAAVGAARGRTTRLWCDDSPGRTGHRRLAVIDTNCTPAVRQRRRPLRPCSTVSCTTVVLRRGSTDGLFRSDTEVLIRAIQRWGLVEALRRVNGMFVAVWDRQERRMGWRDRIMRSRCSRSGVASGGSPHGATLAGSPVAVIAASPCTSGSATSRVRTVHEASKVAPPHWVGNDGTARVDGA